MSETETEDMAYHETPLARAYDRVVLARPWLFVVLLLGLALAGAWFAQEFKVDASADSLVLEGDEDLEFYREISRRYDSPEFLIVAYQPKTPLLGDEALSALDALVADLAAVDGVASVLSLLDVPLLYSPKVSVTALADGVKTLRDPGVDRELVARELRESPIYRQLLTSIEGDTAAIQVNLQRDLRYAELLDARESLREQRNAGELDASGLQALARAEAEFKAYSTVAAERQRVLVAEVRSIIDRHRPAAKKCILAVCP